MAHCITPNQKHIIINARLAFNCTDPNEVTDGLNEALRDQLSPDFLADYIFSHSDEPAIVQASAEPEEGELFVTHGVFIVCVIDETGAMGVVKVESDLPLDTMPAEAARDAMYDHIHFDQGDRIIINRLDNLNRELVLSK